MREGEDSKERQSDGSKEACEFHIVGVGASAGGLEALEQFFGEMPTDSGAAFVVVQHLSPDFKSHMEQLLARQTEIPVFRVEDRMEVKQNSIYLIPPRKEMIISGGRLLLTDKDPKSLTHPIDQFFRSLATDCGKFAIGVVLSGTGSHGSRGIRAIHEGGGLVLAQSPESAKFDGMPVNARETGIVDLVLAPEAMAGAITTYVKSSLSPEQFSEQQLPKEQLEGVQKIFELLRADFNLDFSHYKPATVARRVRRRVELNGYADLPTYVERVQADPTELNDLYRDLLIGVTRFFRDTEAFQRLEEDVIPAILDRARAGEPVRAWVAGCATGEEAYSIAMLFHEQLTAAKRSLDDFKLFATDVHRSSIHTAAAGVYSAEALAEVSDERRARYFRERRDGWHVVPELRKLVVFAPHNVISDAPFTQMDLVTCRNLLIYLQPTAQKKALSLFHFALKTGGTLMLGPSETPGEISDEFDQIDKRWKIFRKRRDIRLPAELRLPLGSPSPPSTAHTRRSTRSASVDGQLLATYDLLLEQHMPPSFLVDDNFNLIHTFGGAERFLAPRGGRTTTRLLDLIHGELRTALAGALQHALKDGSTVRYTGLRIRVQDEAEQVHLIVRPLSDPHTNVTNFLVGLESVSSEIAELPHVDDELSMDELTKEHIQSLEVDLRFTKENLQATIEELETANEELQATNEELVASNEELQSTNEELHSVNEELYTVNTEHQKKIDELTELNDDMDNLLETTGVGVIFLDSDLCIRRFTPEVTKTLDLLPHDIGRRVDNFVHNLTPPDLLDKIRQVRDVGKEYEAEVTDRTGRAHLLRIFPYKSRARVEGIVLNLIDIESLRQSQESSLLRGRLLDLSHDAVLLWKLETEEVAYCNTGAELLYGYTQADFEGRTIHEVLKTVHPVPWSEIETKIRQDGTWFGELRHVAKSGRQLVVSTRHQMVELADGTSLVLETNRDISDQIRTQEALETARREAESANAAKTAFLANVSHELRTPLTAILGFSELLAAQLESDELRDAAQTIRRNGGHLLELVNDILDLTKIEADRLEFRAELCDIHELLIDICKLMDVRAAEKGIDLRLRYDSKVPRALKTDRTRLRQILMNLVSNAIKFSDDGDVELIVDCPFLHDASSGGEPTIRFRVVDSGIGMSEETQAKLFQPFSQADAQVTERFGGTGLGLSISKRLTDRLHGELTADSELGRGSTFTLTLPLTGEPADEELVDPADLHFDLEPAETEHELPRLTGRILVADDRRDVWRVVKHFLENCGATVEVAENGQQALDMVTKPKPESLPFDMVLMDMQMPILSGYEATRRIRASGFEGPIVAITAGAMKGDREKCLSVGCTEYLAKPIDGPHLVQVVHSLLNDTSSDADGHGLRLLVVEDSGDVAALMSQLLTSEGHQVQTATSGSAALEIAGSSQIDVYLVDISLPDMTGFELVRRLKKAAPDSTARFVAVSGHAADDVAENIAASGFDAALEKPINPDELNAALRRLAETGQFT